MSAHWVRVNGQRELRNNLRTALKEAGLTQSAAARQAGVGEARVTNGLGTTNTNWLSRETVTALADLLEISVDELVGDSIFVDQRDQRERFHYRPPEFDALDRRDAERAAKKKAERESRAAKGSTRALCCECGALRTCSAKRYRVERLDLHGGRRYMEKLKCSTCDEVTMHAVLIGKGDRDKAEELDRQPTRYALALRERDQLIERLREFNVKVTFRPGRTSKESDLFLFNYYGFNSNTMQWEIYLDENLPPRAQVQMLAYDWERISSGDRRDIDWDPREGVWTDARDSDWDKAADDLVADIDRFLSIERERMVFDIRDELASGSGADDQGVSHPADAGGVA